MKIYSYAYPQPTAQDLKNKIEELQAKLATEENPYIRKCLINDIKYTARKLNYLQARL